MTDYTEEITFADIREGDELEVTLDDLCLTGVAARVDPPRPSSRPSWRTATGKILATDFKDGRPQSIRRKPRPVPTYEPGVTGTATTIATFSKHGFWAKDENSDLAFWFVNFNGEVDRVYALYVTDFVPDQWLLTPEVLEQTRADERERLALLAERVAAIGKTPNREVSDEDKALYDAHPPVRLIGQLTDVAKWIRNAGSGAR